MRTVLAGLLLAASLSGCAGGQTDERLIVFAAASLSGTFTQLAEDFESEHDGVDVVLAFGGSSDLAAQIVEGAPADVFAAADERTMRTADDAMRGIPRVFATNTLQIVTPHGNPASVASIRDLGRPGTKVAICAPQVPCGAASADLLARARVRVTPVSEEQSVSDVLGKVRGGEVDAGLVYVTDARAARDEVAAVDVPQASRVVNRYPIATVRDARNVRLAEEFVAYVTGPGRDVLVDAGFGAP